MKKIYSLSLIFILVSFFMTGCTKQEKIAAKSLQPEASQQIFAMDTFMDLKIYGNNCEKALAQSITEIKRLEALFSPILQNSDVVTINENAGKSPVSVSEDTINIINHSIQLNEQTKGAFDIAIAPIMNIWGFLNGEHRVPAKEEIQALLPLTNSDNIFLDKENKTVFLKEQMSIDFGAIGKGYTSDRLNEIMKKNGIESAILSLGGNISAYGTRTDGKKWRVAIQNPEDSESIVAIVNVEDKSVITSGAYQRFFEENGIQYHHIIDPQTGSPSQSGLTSVTIISEDGTMADGLSTSLFIMGAEKAVSFWKEYGGFDAVLITEDKKIYVTEPLVNNFELKTKKNEYQLEVISKN